MKSLVIFLSIIQLLLAICDQDCECATDPKAVHHEEGIGCSQTMTCNNTEHLAELLKDSSTVPGIEDNWAAWLTDLAISERPVTIKEYFIPLGLVCENGNWYATKFPYGIQSLEGLAFTAEEANGKGYKARIKSLAC